MTFVPGLEMARAFYAGTVGPMLRELGIRHSAGRLGPGSDVLGLDTERSRDHDWWYRLDIFAEDPAQVPELRIPGLAEHRIAVHEIGAWLTGILGTDPRAGLTARGWLAIPAQRLLEVTAGAVFHDGLGVLAPVREQLTFYPGDVWRFQLAGLWSRIEEEQPFAGRCGEVGDDLGSRLVTARLARDVLRLGLLYQRRYPPYAKWLGSAAGQNPHLATALSAGTWQEREEALLRSYADLIAAHNATGLTAPVDATPRPFHDRPFRVVDTAGLIGGLMAGISDPVLRGAPPTGGVDMISDNSDVLCDARLSWVAGQALPQGLAG
ncbi:DUF4037 domain-containing protein [Longispora albida]|uniref:DUF4037 domain-containing protein n=1 Tax=Longispora albida TaxID=203523 RepID=UPI00036BF137|nr:DUF4037 domain-containing protein [Longispora albida]